MFSHIKVTKHLFIVWCRHPCNSHIAGPCRHRKLQSSTRACRTSEAPGFLPLTQEFRCLGQRRGVAGSGPDCEPSGVGRTPRSSGSEGFRTRSRWSKLGLPEKGDLSSLERICRTPKHHADTKQRTHGVFGGSVVGVGVESPEGAEHYIYI